MTENKAEIDMPIDENPDTDMKSEEEVANLGSKPERMPNKTQPQEDGVRTDSQATQQHTEQSEEEFDPQEEGIEEAKEAKSAASGNSEREKTEQALQSKLQGVEEFEREIQKTKQNLAQLSQHREDLEGTIARVESASDDHTIMEHLDAQVASVEVKPDERDDFVSRLQDKVDATDEQIEGYQKRGRALQRGLMKCKVAAQWLNAHLSNLS